MSRPKPIPTKGIRSATILDKALFSRSFRVRIPSVKAITAKGGRFTPPEGGSGPEYQKM